MNQLKCSKKKTAYQLSPQRKIRVLKIFRNLITQSFMHLIKGTVTWNCFLLLKVWICWVCSSTLCGFNNLVGEIHTLEPPINPCYWQLEQQENPCLWYLEQQENSCYGIKRKSKLMLWYLEQQMKFMQKVIWATRKSMPQFQGPIFWKLGIWAKIITQTWKNWNTTFINKLIWTIFRNKNI